MKIEHPSASSLFANLTKTIATVAVAAVGLSGGLRGDEPSLKIHGLINLEFSDHYITPRGLNVEDKGLIIQPLTLLFWDLYSANDGGLDDVSLTTGFWNSWHTNKSGAQPGHWNEIDPIVGLTFKAMKKWQFDAGFTAFHSEVGSYPTSTNLDLKLSYHDDGFNGVTLNPYVEFFDELHEKATVALNPPTSRTSHYFAFGIDPTLKVETLKLELPTFVNLVAADFYQKFDGTGGGSGLAVFSTELKATLPVDIPKSYGFWSVYAGVQYYHLNNDGLLDGNEVLATSKRNHNLYQLHAGLTIFF